MKANELMIGNWINIKSAWSYRNELPVNMDFKWEDRDWYAVGECGMDLDDIRPIPLTEEWLLKFGFEESGRDLNIIHWYNGIIYLNSYEIDFNGYWLRHYQGRNHCKIIHVHQLQNLIFALTGTELEIK